MAGAQEVFYNTCPAGVADAAAARLRPHTISAFVQPVTAVAWRDVPATYVICHRDNATRSRRQEAMSARAGTTHRLDSDHSPFLTIPPASPTCSRRGAVAGAPAS